MFTGLSKTVQQLERKGWYPIYAVGGKPQNDHCSGLREQTSNSTESSVFAYIDNIVYLLSLSLFKQRTPSKWTGFFVWTGRRAVYRTFKILPKIVQHSPREEWYPIDAVREYPTTTAPDCGSRQTIPRNLPCFGYRFFSFSLSFSHGMGRTADRPSSPFHFYQKKLKKVLTKKDVWSIINYAVRTISSAGRASA